jgi:hypothetical protein
MNKVIIQATPNADTRTATEFTKELLLSDTKKHIKAVCLVLWELAGDLYHNGLKHDKTKLSDLDQFFQDFQSKKTGAEFKKLPWWQVHLTERHHLNDRCPDDVNILDVLEMVADGVCAGKARSGAVYPIEISNEILQKALRNTQKMLEESVEVAATPQEAK